MTGVDRAASDPLVDGAHPLLDLRYSKNYMYAKEENWTNN